MILLMLMIILTLLIATFVMGLSSLLSKKEILEKEKTSPFECGFSPFSSPRKPFSIKFFLIAIIFLIFDVEIALMLPMITTLKTSNFFIWFITSSTFISILLIGLFHEWNQGALNWTI